MFKLFLVAVCALTSCNAMMPGLIQGQRWNLQSMPATGTGRSVVNGQVMNPQSRPMLNPVGSGGAASPRVVYGFVNDQMPAGQPAMGAGFKRDMMMPGTPQQPMPASFGQPNMPGAPQQPMPASYGQPGSPQQPMPASYGQPNMPGAPQQPMPVPFGQANMAGSPQQPMPAPFAQPNMAQPTPQQNMLEAEALMALALAATNGHAKKGHKQAKAKAECDEFGQPLKPNAGKPIPIIIDIGALSNRMAPPSNVKVPSAPLWNVAKAEQAGKGNDSTGAISQSAESLKPSADPSMPSTEPLRPSADPSMPSTEPIKPSAEPIKPSDEPIKSTGETFRPIAGSNLAMTSMQINNDQKRVLKKSFVFPNKNGTMPQRVAMESVVNVPADSSMGNSSASNGQPKSTIQMAVGDGQSSQVEVFDVSNNATAGGNAPNSKTGDAKSTGPNQDTVGDLMRWLGGEGPETAPTDSNAGAEHADQSVGDAIRGLASQGKTGKNAGDGRADQSVGDAIRGLASQGKSGKNAGDENADQSVGDAIRGLASQGKPGKDAGDQPADQSVADAIRGLASQGGKVGKDAGDEHAGQSVADAIRGLASQGGKQGKDAGDDHAGQSVADAIRGLASQGGKQGKDAGDEPADQSVADAIRGLASQGKLGGKNASSSPATSDTVSRSGDGDEESGKISITDLIKWLTSKGQPSATGDKQVKVGGKQGKHTPKKGNGKKDYSSASFKPENNSKST